MFAQTALQAQLEHPVSQESPERKDTSDLQGKMVKTVIKALREQLDLKGPLELMEQRVLKVIEDPLGALETKETRVTRDLQVTQVLLE